VLDLGERQTRLVLCLGNVPVLARTAGTGGLAWTERIGRELQISPKAAEVHKREHGIALTGRGVRQSSPAAVEEVSGTPKLAGPATDPDPRLDHSPRREHAASRDLKGESASSAPEAHASAPRAQLSSLLLGCLRSELTAIAAEVKRSYEYVLSCYQSPGSEGKRSPADLILVGGGAAMRNLPEFLRFALGIPVRRASDYLRDEPTRLRCSGVAGPSRSSSGSRSRVGSTVEGLPDHLLEVFALAVGLAIQR
jgi:Tfp pilus assembly PilM family ATPase